MDLHTFIADQGRRVALAEACGTSPAYLYQIATGRRRPSADLAAAIEEATKGEVSKVDLIFGQPSGGKGNA